MGLGLEPGVSNSTLKTPLSILTPPPSVCPCGKWWDLLVDLNAMVLTHHSLSLFPKVVALNKRSQEAEAAFLSVYKQLIEAPGKKHSGSGNNVQ